MSTLLVTGGSGFVAGHVVAQALAAGHTVRATVRSPAREPGLRAALARVVPDTGDRLAFVHADLLSDDGWAAACAGVDQVLHVASPLTATQDEEEVIRPAVDGTLRVLRAARDAGVRRVVATSSCGAVYYGHPPRTEPFTEADWTNVGGGPMSAYVKSKALAERAAWAFLEREGGGLELTTIQPTGIFGPALTAEIPSSLRIVDRLLAGGMPACPDLWFAVVDVRDVADLHLRALTAPEAANQRFIATAGEPVSLLEIARLLRARLGDRAAKVPTRKMPDWIVRLGGLFNNELRALLPLLGTVRPASSAKARRVLGWTPRPWEEAIVASAESVLAARSA